MSDRVEGLCRWMRQHVRRPSVARRLCGASPPPPRLSDTPEGRERLLRQRQRSVARALAIRMSRCLYDPRTDYWTISAECPEWADEMRSILRRVTPYQRRRK
jgi:hypothetical protein